MAPALGAILRDYMPVDALTIMLTPHGGEGQVFIYAGAEKPESASAKMADPEQWRHLCRSFGHSHTPLLHHFDLPYPNCSHLREKGFREGIIVPLWSRETLIGCLTINSRRTGVYTAVHVQRMQEVLVPVVLAIRTKHLEQALKGQIVWRDGLYRLTIQLIHEKDTEQFLQHILRTAGEIAHADGASIYIADWQGEQELLRVRASLSQAYVGKTIHPGEGVGGRVYVSGQPFKVDAYQAWEGKARSFAEESLQAVMAVPLIWQGRTIGVLDIYRFTSHPESFLQQDMETLQIFAQQVTTVLEIHRLLQETAQAKNRLQLLNEMVREVNAHTEQEEIFRVIRETSRQLLAYDRLSIGLINTRRDALRFYVLASSVEVGRRTDTIVPRNKSSIMWQAIERREPISCDVVTTHRAFGNDYFNSAVSFPLLLGTTAIGAINIVSARESAFSPGDKALFQQWVNHVALAIDKMQRLQDQHKQLRQLNGVLTMTRALHLSLTEQSVLQKIARTIQQSLDWGVVAMSLVDPVSGRLRLGAVVGMEQSILQAQIDVANAESTGDFRAQLFRPERRLSHSYFFPGESGGDDLLKTPYGVRGQSRAYLPYEWRPTDFFFTPIYGHDGNLLGIISVDQPGNGQRPARQEAEALEVFANQAAIALEYNQQYQKLARRTKYLRMLTTITRAITGQLEPKKLLETMVDQFTEALEGAYGFLFYPLSPEALSLRLLHVSVRQSLSVPFDWKTMTFSLAEHPVLREIVSVAPEPLAVQHLAIGLLDVKRLDPALQNMKVQADGKALLGVAIRDDADNVWILGVLKPGEYVWQDEEIDFLRLLAEQVKIALRNATQYELKQGQVEKLSHLVKEHVRIIRQQRDRAELILSHITDAIALVDGQGRFVYVNRAWRVLTGYDERDLVHGESLFCQLFPAGSCPLPEINATLHQGETWQRQLTFSRKDGSHYIAELIILPVLAADGDLVNAVVLQHDVTRWVTLDKLKSKFVADISHELRTPLTNIKLYQTLLREGKPEARGRYWHVLDQETDRLVMIVEDLLTLSRLERGDVDFQVRIFPVELFLTTLHRNQTPRFQEAGLSLDLLLPEKVLLAKGDEGLLAQALTYLLTNALHYTPVGGRVTLSAGQEANRVWLRVQDSGIGIAPHERERIFERFFRGETARSRYTFGTGLGLVIAKNIVEQMDGAIAIESEVNRGTTATVFLPAGG